MHIQTWFYVEPAVRETQDTRVWSLGQKIPWRRKWQPIPVSVPAESSRQRRLVGYIQSMGSQRVRHNWSDLACKHSCMWMNACIEKSTCLLNSLTGLLLYEIYYKSSKNNRNHSTWYSWGIALLINDQLILCDHSVFSLWFCPCNLSYELMKHI